MEGTQQDNSNNQLATATATEAEGGEGGSGNGSSSVREAFQKNFDEIRRRKEGMEEMAMASDNTGGDYQGGGFEKSKREGKIDFPLQLPNQEFVLYSLSHLKMCPFAEDPTDPAVRIYGAFGSQEEAVQHALEVVKREDPSCNVLLTKVGAWTTMVWEEARVADPESRDRHIGSLLDHYESARKESRQEFDENVKKKQGGKCDASKRKKEEGEEGARRARERAAKTIQEAAPQSNQALKRAGKLSRNAELRDQSFAVVAFLPDPLGDIPEPIFKVLACLETQDDADHYVRNTAGEEESLSAFTLDCCCLYEWLRPQRVDATAITEVYRQSELNSIMQEHKKQPQQVDAVKRWREKAGEERTSAEGKAEAERPPPGIKLIEESDGTDLNRSLASASDGQEGQEGGGEGGVVV